MARGPWKHGASAHGKESPEYSTWCRIKARCHNEKNPDYRYYGGRGIKVCDRWRFSFENFLADMGERPPNLTIDRYPDNNGNYEPGNCRWASRKVQAGNMRSNVMITFNGEAKLQAQWAADLGIPGATIFRRLAAGEPIERVLLVGRLDAGTRSEISRANALKRWRL